MIKPMLAVPLHKANIVDYADWAMEEKFDGHRLVVEVTDDGAQAWTRPRRHAGSSGKTMAQAVLPPHLERQLAQLPPGIYDGELLAGETSTDVRRSDLQHTLHYVVFDVMKQDGLDTDDCNYIARRALLEATFEALPHQETTHVDLAVSHPCVDQATVATYAKNVWGRGGEGLILKRTAALYQPGKRSKDFIKIKKLQTIVCTVVGFEASRGKVMQRGPYAIVLLEDPRGNPTSVKTRDDKELAAFNEHKGTPDTHPALGRMLRIEYQDYTPRDGYRHPRWDRWEDE